MKDPAIHPIRDTVPIKVIVAGDSIITVLASHYDEVLERVKEWQRQQQEPA